MFELSVAKFLNVYIHDKDDDDVVRPNVLQILNKSSIIYGMTPHVRNDRIKYVHV